MSIFRRSRPVLSSSSSSSSAAALTRGRLTPRLSAPAPLPLPVARASSCAEGDCVGSVISAIATDKANVVVSDGRVSVDDLINDLMI